MGKKSVQLDACVGVGIWVLVLLGVGEINCVALVEESAIDFHDNFLGPFVLLQDGDDDFAMINSVDYGKWPLTRNRMNLISIKDFSVVAGDVFEYSYYAAASPWEMFYENKAGMIYICTHDALLNSNHGMLGYSMEISTNPAVVHLDLLRNRTLPMISCIFTSDFGYMATADKGILKLDLHTFETVQTLPDFPTDNRHRAALSHIDPDYKILYGYFMKANGSIYCVNLSEMVNVGKITLPLLTNQCGPRLVPLISPSLNRLFVGGYMFPYIYQINIKHGRFQLLPTSLKLPNNSVSTKMLIWDEVRLLLFVGAEIRHVDDRIPSTGAIVVFDPQTQVIISQTALAFPVGEVFTSPAREGQTSYIMRGDDNLLIPLRGKASTDNFFVKVAVDALVPSTRI